MNNYKPPIFVAGGTLGKKQLIEVDCKGSKEAKFFADINGKRAGIGTLEQVIASEKTGDIIFWTATDEKKVLTPKNNSFCANTYRDGKVMEELSIPEGIEKKIFVSPEIISNGDLIGNFIKNYMVYQSEEFGFEIPQIKSVLDIESIEEAADIARKFVPKDKSFAYLLLGDSCFLSSKELDFFAEKFEGKGDFVIPFINKEVIDAFILGCGEKAFSKKEYKEHKMNFYGMRSKEDGAGLYRFGNLFLIDPLNMQSDIIDVARFMVANRHMQGDENDNVLKKAYRGAKLGVGIACISAQYIGHKPERILLAPPIIRDIARMVYTTLFYENSNAKSLEGFVSPYFENYSKNTTKAAGFRITVVPHDLSHNPAGELYGPGILYDIDTEKTLEFTRKHMRFR